MTEQFDLSKIPPTYREIYSEGLNKLHPSINLANTLNVMNVCFAAIISHKKVKLCEFSGAKPSLVTYNAVALIPSGGGKDYMVRNIKDTLLSKIIESLSPPICEMEEATPAGFLADCQIVNQCECGCILIIMPEFGAFIEESTPTQKGFLNSIIKFFDGSGIPKRIKTEHRSAFKEVPICCFLYSDTDKVLIDKNRKYFENLLSSGMVRRFNITAMKKMELHYNEDYNTDLEIKKAAYYCLEQQGELLFTIFETIQPHAEYIPNDEAYKRYHEYEKENKKQYNSLPEATDEILKKELHNRHWKALRLAVIIAALEHPEDTTITLEDIEYAIFQTELFARDLKQFMILAPRIDVDMLYNFFLENIGKPIPKCTLRKQRFVSARNFSSWFKDAIEYVRQRAAIDGYELIEEPHGGPNGHSGLQYTLIKRGRGMITPADCTASQF